MSAEKIHRHRGTLSAYATECTLLSMLALAAFTIDFPGYEKPFWPRLLYVVLLTVSIVLISIAEHSLRNRGLRAKAISKLMIVKYVFCAVFFVFMFTHGSSKGVKRIWLSISCFLYIVTPQITCLIIKILGSIRE